MCRAITCLSYCIAVTTKSLLFAAEAYPTLEPPLRFLDLVSLRIRRGTLKVNDDDVGSSISAIMQLPLELWDLVRYELIELEVFCAEQRIARGLLCADCQTTMAPNEKLRWRVPEKEPKCDDCSDLECSFEGILNAQRQTTIRQNLLLPFGLCLPTNFSVRRSAEPAESPPTLHADSRTATFLALAPAWEEGIRNALSHECDAGNYDVSDEQSVVDVHFRLPRDADERFKAAVKRYHLQPVRVSDGILAHGNTKKAPRSAALKNSGRLFKLTRTVRPGWKLFTTCETNW